MEKCGAADSLVCVFCSEVLYDSSLIMYFDPL